MDQAQEQAQEPAEENVPDEFQKQAEENFFKPTRYFGSRGVHWRSTKVAGHRSKGSSCTDRPPTSSREANVEKRGAGTGPIRKRYKSTALVSNADCLEDCRDPREDGDASHCSDHENQERTDCFDPGMETISNTTSVNMLEDSDRDYDERPSKCGDVVSEPLHNFKVEVTSPEMMLTYINNNWFNADDITHLQLEIFWVPGTFTGKIRYSWYGHKISKADAEDLRALGRRPKCVRDLEKASPSDICKSLATWLELLHRLSKCARHLRVLDVRCNVYEFEDHWSFVEALARLRVSEKVMLSGSYPSGWADYLVRELGVRVYQKLKSFPFPGSPFIVRLLDHTITVSDADEDENENGDIDGDGESYERGANQSVYEMEAENLT